MVSRGLFIFFLTVLSVSVQARPVPTGPGGVNTFQPPVPPPRSQSPPLQKFVIPNPVTGEPQYTILVPSAPRKWNSLEEYYDYLLNGDYPGNSPTRTGTVGSVVPVTRGKPTPRSQSPPLQKFVIPNPVTGEPQYTISVPSAPRKWKSLEEYYDYLLNGDSPVIRGYPTNPTSSPYGEAGLYHNVPFQSLVPPPPQSQPSFLQVHTEPTKWSLQSQQGARVNWPGNSPTRTGRVAQGTPTSSSNVDVHMRTDNDILMADWARKGTTP